MSGSTEQPSGKAPRRAAARDYARRAKRELRAVQESGERALGIRLFARRAQPRGIDFLDDLARAFDGYRPTTVFDVGANVGDASAACLARFPEAAIVAFEPVAETFERLRGRFADDDRVRCLHLALGAERATASIVTHESAVLSSLAADALVREVAGTTTETVTVDTVDAVSESCGVGHVNLLKIDTEGYDLEVLKGARRMLEREAIDLIETEVSMSPDNRAHVPFDAVRAMLGEFGFEIFGLYDQTPEWTLGRANLRRCNVAFVAPHLIGAFDQGPPAGLRD